MRRASSPAIYATRQWLQRHDNVITAAQALELGLSRGQIRQMVVSGVWERTHRGVFRSRSTKRSAREDLVRAATMSGGRAVVSHRSAAWLLGMIDQPPGRPDVTVPYTTNPSRPGVRVHRACDEVPSRAVKGLRCTTPIRTLIDLAATHRSADLAPIVDKAISSGLVTVAQLIAATEPTASPRRRGKTALRRHLRERGDLGVPEASVLELRMQRLFRRGRLPPPEPELVVEDGRYRLDFAYPALKLAIEVDGYTWHHSPEQVARDKARRNYLRSKGWIILEYTWQMVTDDPDRVIAEIRQAYVKLAAAA